MGSFISSSNLSSVDSVLGAANQLGAAIQTFSSTGASQLNNQISSASSATTNQQAKQIFAGQNSVSNFVKYASDLVTFAPKSKFLFKVMFTFNSAYSGLFNREFMYVVKTIDRPKIDFEYEEVNMYNFRTKVLKTIKQNPINLSFIDDIQNKVGDFFNVYRSAYSPIANLGDSPSQQALEAGGGMMWTPGDPGTSPAYAAASGPLSNNSLNVLSKITLVQVFAHGTAQTSYVFTNPRIESFEFDDLDMSSSEGQELKCTFSYDTLYIQESKTSGTPLYAWGISDIIGNDATESASITAGNTLMGASSNIGYGTNTTSATGIPYQNQSYYYPLQYQSYQPVSSALVGSAFVQTTLSSLSPVINQATAGLDVSFNIDSFF